MSLNRKCNEYLNVNLEMFGQIRPQLFVSHTVFRNEVTDQRIICQAVQVYTVWPNFNLIFHEFKDWNEHESFPSATAAQQ